jgi:hypothetical protein
MGGNLRSCVNMFYFSMKKSVFFLFGVARSLVCKVLEPVDA